ncbi:MAG: hypothetical protein ACOX5A_06485 [Aminivibrio sp.]|jgi:hypothetical protein|nr:hypothetical protein [Synergistaceae bacterium]
MGRYDELNLKNVRTYRASDRVSKVGADTVARPPSPGISFKEFLNCLPDVLKARDIKALAGAIACAKKNARPVIAMFGGHVVKCGCLPVLIDLAKNGFITHFASNGASAIHDVELAAWGQTSEDVAAQLEDGSFGMARDTAEILNTAARIASADCLGLGESLGRLLEERKVPFGENSLALQSYKLSVPYTVHVALGTDIVHQHPDADGAAIGDATLRDFRIFAASVAKLERGGVVLNIGSAVLMPEVFLKALSVARNLGHGVKDITTANLDMIQHYRPMVNVVSRPVLSGGRGYSITGHHEIMIPLLAAAIYEEYASCADK